MDAATRRLAQQWLAAGPPAVVVEVLETRGSAPREAGARMVVAAGATVGTIGGGHLELKAIARARALLGGGQGAPVTGQVTEQVTEQVAEQFAGQFTGRGTGQGTEHVTEHVTEHYALGPSLGQCCGGAVTLGYALLDAAALARWPVPATLFHLQLHGAGHVGRAIATLLATLDVVVDWIDERDDEFPATTTLGSAWPAHIRRVAADTSLAVEAEVGHAPPGAFYLVLTHRHDLDLRIAEAILARGDAGFFGLIGSTTKRRRFVHRFEARGVGAGAIARMTCPIGIDDIDGKAPEVVALAVVAQLLQYAGRLDRGA